MRYLLVNVPTPILWLLIVGGSVVVMVTATWLVRRIFPEDVHAANNEVAGFMFATVGVIYGVLLAFVVLVVWQTYQDAQVTVEREANAMADLYRTSDEVPQPYADDLRQSLVRYANVVINEEWPLMEKGDASQNASDALENIWDVHHRLHNESATVGPHDALLAEFLSELGNDRRIRLLETRSELPPLMWLLLIGGGVVTLAFTLFFRTRNLVAHLLMAGMLAGIVSFVLFLIIELDSPFSGAISVPPVAFQQAAELFGRLK